MRSSTTIHNLIFFPFHLQGKNVTNNLNITYVHNGLLYKVNISLLFHKTSININQQSVIFDCDIGTENIIAHFCISKDTCTEMHDTVVSGMLIIFQKHTNGAIQKMYNHIMSKSKKNEKYHDS